MAESQEKQVNLRKDLAEMQEWMAQVDEEFLMRDFEYKSPEELEASLEEMKVTHAQTFKNLKVPHHTTFSDLYFSARILVENAFTVNYSPKICGSLENSKFTLFTL